MAELPPWLRFLDPVFRSTQHDPEPTQQEQGYADINRQAAGMRNYIADPASRPDIARATQSMQRARTQPIPAPRAQHNVGNDPAFRNMDLARARQARDDEAVLQAGRRGVHWPSASFEPTVREERGRSMMQQAPGNPAAYIPGSALSREARALLNIISEFEGTSRGADNGYRTNYGGSEFESYADHPRTPRTITSGPDQGGNSTAAGRYQFIGSTWDNMSRRLGLTDFSPANQDRAAWQYAQDMYSQYLRSKGMTGDLQTDLQNQGRWRMIAAALGRPAGAGWASFPEGRQPARTMEQFIRSMHQQLGGQAREEPRSVREFLGLEHGYRTAPRGQRRARDFLPSRPRTQSVGPPE